jgi:hypothetical protein
MPQPLIKSNHIKDVPGAGAPIDSSGSGGGNEAKAEEGIEADSVFTMLLFLVLLLLASMATVMLLFETFRSR